VARRNRRRFPSRFEAREGSRYRGALRLDPLEDFLCVRDHLRGSRLPSFYASFDAEQLMPGQRYHTLAASLPESEKPRARAGECKPESSEFAPAHEAKVKRMADSGVKR